MSDEIIIGPGSCKRCGGYVDYNPFCESCANAEVNLLNSKCAEKDAEIAAISKNYSVVLNSATAVMDEKDREIARLKVKLKTARKALEWYEEFAKTTEIEYDHGQKAFKALKQIGE